MMVRLLESREVGRQVEPAGCTRNLPDHLAEILIAAGKAERMDKLRDKSAPAPQTKEQPAAPAPAPEQPRTKDEPDDETTSPVVPVRMRGRRG